MGIAAVLLILLCAVLWGGWVARRTFTGVNLLVVPGALLGFIGVCKFFLYLALCAPIYAILVYFTVPDDRRHTAFSIDHLFHLSFENSPVSISDIGNHDSQASEILQLVAQVRVAGSDLYSLLIIVGFILIIWVLMYLILRNAEAVLRSLYERTPFVAENPMRLRHIATFVLVAWLSYCCYIFVMTAYLQSQLTIEGAELTIVSLPIIAPLIAVGLLTVLAEVFRVGYELKQENEFTV